MVYSRCGPGGGTWRWFRAHNHCTVNHSSDSEHADSQCPVNNRTFVGNDYITCKCCIDYNNNNSNNNNYNVAGSSTVYCEGVTEGSKADCRLSVYCDE